jgi:NADPH:quinone reductase-like Zn-dependent oxidoreductase
MTVTMKANRIHVFGGPEVILFEDVPRPTPGTGEVLVRVHAAGVGPWDAWVRAGRSALLQPLPLTLGADLAGTVEAPGSRDSPFSAGDEVFGVTNPAFYRCVRPICARLHSHAGAQAPPPRLPRVCHGAGGGGDRPTDALSDRSGYF